MASMKRGAIAASTLVLIAVIASACNQPYSTPPATATSLFNTPIGQTPNITMSDVANFGTQTAIAQLAAPGAAETQTLAAGLTPQDVATATPLVSTNPAVSETTTLAVIGTPNSTQSGPLSTSAPVGTRPAEYTLHSGEFPYCIARRFDVDPGALLSLNGLANGNIVYPGRTLRIPQSGSFPGTRAREPHPATYTVASSSETLYSIACRYGDVDPVAFATANGLSSPDASLTAGMQLKFP